MNLLLTAFEDRFVVVHDRSTKLLTLTGEDFLYRRPREIPKTFAMFSVGEYLLRSAAAVEQTFGGITTKLWDDPFEWTLPEKLSTKATVLAYLNDVEATRQKGFLFFRSDEDLNRRLPAPERLASITELLLATVARAEHFQGRAFAIFQMFSDEKLPRL
ncbi:MAG TPA: hypothetical protein VGQ55_13080 [Pyrinomonadaceae bacterium]|nr:hypothetical protein [Pyrinomonadaceae bacterium]